MWLPEFQGVLDRAGARLDETTLELRVDDPQYGPIGADAPFDPYSRSSAEWLRARDADVRTIATTVGERRSVGEFEVALTQGVGGSHCRSLSWSNRTTTRRGFLSGSITANGPCSAGT